MINRKEELLFRKSSHSGGPNGSCVEVANSQESLVIRDSKDKAGPRLKFNRRDWKVFVDSVRSG